MSTRGVSITLSYILTLGITTVLISGLIVAGSGFVIDQREQVIDQELTVIGNQLAGTVEQADRLANASQGDPTTLYINETFPQQVTGSPYTVELKSGDPAQVVLTSRSPVVTIRVNTTVETPVSDAERASGGTISVAWDGGESALVIRDV